MIKLYEDKEKNFYVRPFTKADITERYLSWFHDIEVTKYTSHGLFGYTWEQAIEFLENSQKAGDIIWAVIMQKTLKIRSAYNEYVGGDISWIDNYNQDTHIGNVALQNISKINRTAEFACIFGEKEHWGKGIGTAIARLIFNHGFNKLNLNKIYLGTIEDNMGMKRVAQRLGMRQEGTLIDHVFLNGSYQNIIQYGVLKDEWNRRNSK